MRYRISILLLAATAALAACGKSQDEKNADTAAAINQAIAKAQAAGARGDPWTAAAALIRETQAALQANDGCAGGGCTRSPTVLRAEEARWKLVQAALDQAQPVALATIFGTDAILNKPVLADTPARDFKPESISRWADSLLMLADRTAGGEEGERALLVAAGNILEAGRYVQRDTYRATGFYARAWLAGDTKAAGEAARSYFDVGDVRNAYLWAIRCTNDCDLRNPRRPRGTPLDIDSLQRGLTAQAAAQAQKAAADRTVVELEIADLGPVQAEVKATRVAQ